MLGISSSLINEPHVFGGKFELLPELLRCGNGYTEGFGTLQRQPKFIVMKVMLHFGRSQTGFALRQLSSKVIPCCGKVAQGTCP